MVVAMIVRGYLEPSNMSVYFNNNFIGTVVSINDMGNGNDVFVIKDRNKTIYVPKNDNFIEVLSSELKFK